MTPPNADKDAEKLDPAPEWYECEIAQPPGETV